MVKHHATLARLGTAHSSKPQECMVKPAMPDRAWGIDENGMAIAARERRRNTEKLGYLGRRWGGGDMGFR